MQVYPQLINLENVIFFAANSKFALSSTIHGDFPPSSRMQGVRFSAAAFCTNFPFSGLPVKIMISNFLEVKDLATSTAPSIT